MYDQGRVGLAVPLTSKRAKSFGGLANPHVGTATPLSQPRKTYSSKPMQLTDRHRVFRTDNIAYDLSEDHHEHQPKIAIPKVFTSGSNKHEHTQKVATPISSRKKYNSCRVADEHRYENDHVQTYERRQSEQYQPPPSRQKVATPVMASQKKFRFQSTSSDSENKHKQTDRKGIAMKVGSNDQDACKTHQHTDVSKNEKVINNELHRRFQFSNESIFRSTSDNNEGPILSPHRHAKSSMEKPSARSEREKDQANRMNQNLMKVATAKLNSTDQIWQSDKLLNKKISSEQVNKDMRKNDELFVKTALLVLGAFEKQKEQKGNMHSHEIKDIFQDGGDQRFIEALQYRSVNSDLQNAEAKSLTVQCVLMGLGSSDPGINPILKKKSVVINPRASKIPDKTITGSAKTSKKLDEHEEALSKQLKDAYKLFVQAKTPEDAKFLRKTVDDLRNQMKSMKNSKRDSNTKANNSGQTNFDQIYQEQENILMNLMDEKQSMNEKKKMKNESEKKTQQKNEVKCNDANKESKEAQTKSCCEGDVKEEGTYCHEVAQKKSNVKKEGTYCHDFAQKESRVKKEETYSHEATQKGSRVKKEETYSHEATQKESRVKKEETYSHEATQEMEPKLVDYEKPPQEKSQNLQSDRRCEDEKKKYSKEYRMHTNIIAPADLPEGYKFEAWIGNSRIVAQVPPGGVTKGQVFSTPMIAVDEVSISVPLGEWRDDICDCCSNGSLALLLCSIFTPHISLGQTMARNNLDWLGKRGSKKDTRNTCYATTAIFIVWILLNVIGALVIWKQWFRGGIPQYSDIATIAVLNVVFVIYTIYAVSSARSSIRHEYYIEEKVCQGCEDFCCSVWCSCCVISHMARHTVDHNTYRTVCCSKTGVPDHLYIHPGPKSISDNELISPYVCL